MRIDFARLNHILIPKTKEERDRFRTGLIGKITMPIGHVFGSLTNEGWLMLVVTPLAGAVAIDVQRTSAYVVATVLFALVLASLAAAPALRLVRGTVTVAAPRRITVGDEATFRVTCRREASAGAAPVSVLLRGPFLPWDGKWTSGVAEELVLAPGKSVDATMRARFIARGLHHLDTFTAAIVAPLGLTCGPRVHSDGVKVYVVPRIATVARLPLAIATKHQPGGVALASKAGESMDLLGVRPYRPGDPVRDLHARTWARTGTPAVREYQQEYFTRVGVIFDTSERDRDRLEAGLELVAGILAHLSHGEALIDVLVVGDAVHELTLGRSLGRLDQALELLSTVARGPALDASRLVARLAPHLEQLSTVFLVHGEGASGAAELARLLRGRGLGCTAIAVDAKLARAIANREALSF